MNKNNIGAVLGEMGYMFIKNIQNHMQDFRLNKGDDVEWLLEPLDEISHPADYVLDAFKDCTPWEWSYRLYFYKKGASSFYTPYNQYIKWYDDMEQGKSSTSMLDLIDMEIVEELEPNPYDKSKIIKGYLDFCAANKIPGIWNDLIIPFTTIGIWQAVLLHQTVTLFPKGWHANYMKSIYVYSLEDIQMIIKKHKRESYEFDHEKLATYLNRDDIMPSVEIDGDKAIASYFYWNDWSGFCRRIIPIEKQGHSVKFGKFEREKLVGYDCGWKY